jgi:hypothetical protein
MSSKINETKFTHTKATGTTKTITIPATTAGTKLLVFVSGGAIATFRITDSGGTTFTRRNPYGGGNMDASWHDFTSVGGETAVHMTLNGAENVAGVVYEVADLGAFIAASSNAGGSAVNSSSNFQLKPSSSITVTGKSVLFGGFALTSGTATNSTRRWRQFGPAGSLSTVDAHQPGQDAQFIWATGYADIDQNNSYPENLSAGNYRATSQFVAATGETSYAAQVAYSNAGVNINADPANSIVKENSLPGIPRANWFLGNSGTNSTIAGYTDKTSYSAGDTVNFKVDSTNNAFRVEIYRLGFYGNEVLGARCVTGDAFVTGSPTTQSAPSVDGTLGHTTCAWSSTATWTIPSDATPGFYYVLFRRTDVTTNVASGHFIVKGSPTNKTVLVSPDCTYQAYNIWGATTDNGNRSTGTWTGRSLYQLGNDGASANFAHRSYAVSFDRPYSVQATNEATYVFDSEYGIMLFAEAQGYDVTYASEIDLENNDQYLINAKLVMSNGHPEYWTTNMWNAYKNARDNGVNIMFNGSNIALWRTRFASADTNKRTIICYKDSGTVDTSAGFTGTGRDPLEYTGTWRDSRTTTPNNTDRRPEDSLTGQWFKVSATLNDTLGVPFASKSIPIWRNSSSVQALTTGQTYTAGAGTIGDELDFVDPSSVSKPTNLVQLNPVQKSYTGQAANANGSTYIGNTGNINVGFSLYRDDSGSLVFATGSWRAWLPLTRWQKGNYQSGSTPDVNWQNAFLAVLHDLGVDYTALTTVVPADSAMTDPATGAPGPTQDDIAIAYGLEVPVESSGKGNFIGFFFGN